MSGSRLTGILLIAGAVVVFAGAMGWGASNMGNESQNLRTSGFILLAILAALIALPMAGVGIFLLRQGAQQEQEESESEFQRRVLDIVQSRGQVNISDLAIELQADRDTLRETIHRLVGLGVFSGYINWDKGILYSADAAGLRELKQCKNCGGDIRLSGKGVATCPWCGTEYFLT